MFGAPGKPGFGNGGKGGAIIPNGGAIIPGGHPGGGGGQFIGIVAGFC